MKTKRPPAPQREPNLDAASLHRSGAVARMLRMPVATLRVWERRYGLTRTAPSAGGQRLYSADDVRRLALIKQLTDLGHAVGSVAGLDMARLQQVAATHAEVSAATRRSTRAETDQPPPVAGWRLAVVGAALAARLQRPALRRWLGPPLVLLGPFDDLAAAAAGLQPAEVDAVLMHEPQLQAGWQAAADARVPSLAKVPKAVLYGFASEPVCEALAAAGTALLRDPQPDVVLAQWLQALAKATPPRQLLSRGALREADAAAPRRWDDAALAEFAGLSSTIACECPRHVAELLLQLSHFEAYSAECEHRNTADAEIHAYLKRVAATSRTRFEQALERVAMHEGLMMPATAKTAVQAAASGASKPQAATPRRRR